MPKNANIASILKSIDEEIVLLEQAKAILIGEKSSARVRKAITRQKRALSPEARKKIADAQKRRWAKDKKVK